MESPPTTSFEIASTAGSVAGWFALAAAAVLVGARLARGSPTVAKAAGATLRPLWQTLPGVRGAARLGAAAQWLRALDPCLRAEMPLHEALRRAAPAAGCRAVTKSALVAAERAERGASIEDVASAMLLPVGVRARFVLAASRAPAAFADAVGGLAAECAERYRNALDVRARVLHLTTTTLVGALVLTQLLGVFTMLEAVRRGISPW
jgi:type II secretory pathway component PulF